MKNQLILHKNRASFGLRSIRSIFSWAKECYIAKCYRPLKNRKWGTHKLMNSMKAARNILLIELGFLGLGAIAGGGALIISPTGELLGMPLSMLEKSPFSNFFIPGIILFLVLGVLPMLLVFALLKKPKSGIAEKVNFFKDMHWTWTFSIYTGFALISWIQLQMVFIQGVHWLHTFYIFLAILILFIALLPQVRNLYKK